MDKLTKWLKKLRIEEELTLQEFSKVMGYNSSSYACGIESGRIKPSSDFMDKILGLYPKYEKHREYLEELVRGRIETMDTQHLISKEFLGFCKRVSKLSPSKRDYVYSEMEGLLDKIEK